MLEGEHSPGVKKVPSPFLTISTRSLTAATIPESDEDPELEEDEEVLLAAALDEELVLVDFFLEEEEDSWAAAFFAFWVAVAAAEVEVEFEPADLLDLADDEEEEVFALQLGSENKAKGRKGEVRKEGLFVPTIVVPCRPRYLRPSFF